MKTPWPHLALFLGPAALLLLGVLALPLICCLALSFCDTTLTTLSHSLHFVGLTNYASLMVDGSFRHSLGLFVLFMGCSTALEIAFAVAVAFYLDQIVHVPKWVETLLLVPMFVIPAASGLTFRYMLDPNEGVVALLFELFDRPAPGFLGHPVLAAVAVLAQDFWRMWPFVFIMIYAGMKSLPREPVEALRLDGAGPLTVLRYAILPMLRRSIVVAALLKSVESLRAFTEIFVMTGGGPGEATSILSMYIVKQAFTFFKLGRAAAASMLLLACGIGLAVILQRLVVGQRPRGEMS